MANTWRLPRESQLVDATAAFIVADG